MFQLIMDTLLNDIDFEVAYIDDISIKSGRQEQHPERVKKFLKK